MLIPQNTSYEPYPSKYNQDYNQTSKETFSLREFPQFKPSSRENNSIIKHHSFQQYRGNS